jgi:radical SAM superfamily enzyme YgiQ (UPF0313 family)
VEIGLQSINRNALSAIHRPTDIEKFLKGIQLLKDRDVETKIDLILGLPKDDPDSFRDTLKFMVEHDLAYDAELFMLSLLPGTRLRKEAGRYGINYLERPPYHITSSDTFQENDFKSLWEEAEDLLDTNFSPPPFLDLGYRINGKPPSLITDGGFVRKIIIDRNSVHRSYSRIAELLFHPY